MVSLSQKDTTFTKIFVGGLPYHTTDETLRKFFEKFGEIDEAVVIADRATGKSRGYGFVTMATKEAAQEAIRDPNPVIDGRRANVNLAYLGAKPRTANSGLNNVALQSANTVLQLGGGYPTLQSYGLQPLIYPAHALLGHANLLQYGNNNSPAGLTPAAAAAAAAAAAHYSNAYDFTSQYNQAQLDAQAASAGFPYGSSQALSAAAAAAAASNPANVANYAYAALAQQAIAAGATAYQP